MGSLTMGFGSESARTKEVVARLRPRRTVTATARSGWWADNIVSPVVTGPEMNSWWWRCLWDCSRKVRRTHWYTPSTQAVRQSSFLAGCLTAIV